MGHFADTEPRDQAETANGNGFPDDTGGENAAPGGFASVDAQGLDFAPAFDTSAPLNPLTFAGDASDAPDFLVVLEADVNEGRTLADANASRLVATLQRLRYRNANATANAEGGDA